MKISEKPFPRFPLLFLVLLVYAPDIVSQVTIKEKITLSPATTAKSIRPADGSLNTAEGVQSGFIMPKKGIVQIYYSSAQRWFSPVPTTAKLLVHRRFRAPIPTSTDTIVTDPVRPRFQDSVYSIGNDVGCIPTSWPQYNYSHPLQPYSAIPVQSGDTVQFYYITDIHPINGVMDTIAIAIADTTAFGWDVTFGVWDNCRSNWNDMVSVFIGIADTTIQFTPLDSNNVYPTIDLVTNNQGGKRNWIDLELKVQFGDSLINNYWVKVDSTSLVDSGGHSHTNFPRPKARFIVPRIPSTLGFDTVITFTKQTDSTGRVKFKFLASGFGGIERIKAWRVNDTTSYDTLRLTTKVPGLIVFSGSGNYQLTGSLPAHPNNHYIVNQSAINSLINAANQFALAAWNTTGIMRLNDISLRYGGGFDIGGGWDFDIAKIKRRKGHRTHREGRSVDIENLQVEAVDTVSHLTGNDTTFTIPKVKWIKKFKRFMEIDLGNWKFLDEGQVNPNIFTRTRKFPHFEWTGN